MNEGFTLSLRATPAVLMLDLLATLDGLQREIQIVGFDQTDHDLLDRRTQEAILTDRDGMGTPRHAIHDQAAAARAAGFDRVDIEAGYRAAEVAPSLAATAAVGVADEAARRGDLLAAPMTPEQRRLWEWVGAELRSQSAGGPATPFPSGA